MKKLKMWQNTKTQNFTKLKNGNVIKLQNSKCDKTLKLKMWINSKTQNGTNSTAQNLTKLKKSKFDKTQKLKYDKKIKN